MALGVSGDLLAGTAVSEDVAKAMAVGATARCPADIVAAITGVAGPEPDEDGNPVGLVIVAVASRDGRTRAERHDFGKRDKKQIRVAASAAALSLVESLLDEGDLNGSASKCTSDQKGRAFPRDLADAPGAGDESYLQSPAEGVGT